MFEFNIWFEDNWYENKVAAFFLTTATNDTQNNIIIKIDQV